MTSTASPLPTPARRRVRKRILIPVILLGLLLLVLVGLFVRGVWSDTVEKNPASVGQGTVTQLYRGPDGRKVVRCAILVDALPAEVWAVINDYSSHDQFLPYVSALTATPLQDGKIHLVGVAHSSLWGDWSFESDVSSKATPDKGEYAAWWDESDDELTTDHGRWDLSPTGAGETLVVFTLEIELSKYPSFMVRNILMDRLYKVLEALRAEVRRRRA
jgi:ribosome-associated toxin RatA of RatAB toxin-antitoxin module